jgi:hypothetical protein
MLFVDVGGHNLLILQAHGAANAVRIYTQSIPESLCVGGSRFDISR